jgi:hypothetical protein
VKRLAFLSALAVAAFAAAPAVAEDGFDVKQVTNPGFVYELAPGSSAGSVVARLRNGTSTTQTVFRNFPMAEKRFIVTYLDSEDHHVPQRPAPSSYGRVTSSGTALAPGGVSESQVDLNRLFVLIPGHHYHVKARTDLRFGPADRIIVASLRSNEITIAD